MFKYLIQPLVSLSLLLQCVAGDGVLQIPVTVLSSFKPAPDGEHLAMFIAVQVQREASSTMEQGKLAAAPLCGKRHHAPWNHNKDTEGEKTERIKKNCHIFSHSEENISSKHQQY